MFMIEEIYSHVGGCICLFMVVLQVVSVFVFKKFATSMWCMIIRKLLVVQLYIFTENNNSFQKKRLQVWFGMCRHTYFYVYNVLF